jgi:SAM-dependent methyltransferase
MRIILAATWNPRGEEERFRKLVTQLVGAYSGIALALPPDTDATLLQVLDEIINSAGPIETRLFSVQPDWSCGRYQALQQALELPGDFIQYADFDRLLHWVETQPEEWRQTVAAIQGKDCVIFARDPNAYQTHPNALVQTEALSNLVGSYFLGQPADLSAGSKGFSRQSVEFLMANTQPGKPFGADAEWPIILRRGGFRIGVIQVAGLDWESADRYLPKAADLELQRKAATLYDSDPSHWAYRTDVAQEIIQSAFEAAHRRLQPREPLPFDFDSVFEVDDYMYFYQDMLTISRTEQQVVFLVRELDLAEGMSILDLACGFGRHANRLAARGYKLTGIDLTPGFLDIARKEALDLGLSVNYLQGDMRQIDFYEQFDRILLLFTAFGYFEDHENFLVLQNMACALKPGGLLVFDIHNRDTFLKGFSPYNVTEKEGNLMIDRHTFDSLTGRLTNRRIVIRNGVRRDKPYSVRMYNPSEIKLLLAQAGLVIIKLFGDWDSTPISSDSRRMIIIAKKS